MYKFTKVVSISFCLLLLKSAYSEMRLFPSNLPKDVWTSFKAADIEPTVTGIIYTNTSNLWSGMPLGGLGTGSITIENDGTLGYSTLFSHVWGHDAGSDGSPAWRDITWANGENGLVEKYVSDPSRGKIGLPFLSLTMQGKTWALSTKRIPGVFSAKHIEYWGHYPFVCLEYETGAPVNIGVELWSPFIPGDKDNSSIPAAVIEVNLRNNTNKPKCGSVTMGFPGPSERETAGLTPSRKSIQSTTSPFHGLRVDFGKELSYALVTSNTGSSPPTSTCETSTCSWNVPHYQLPPYPLKDKASETGSSLTIPFFLEPKIDKTIYFILSWYTQKWYSDFPYDGFPDRSYVNRYTEQFPDVTSVTEYLVHNQFKLKQRVREWQSVIYRESCLPDWLHDGLINSLHLITKCAFWASSRSEGLSWSAPEGVFSLVESTVADGQQSCIPCDWYGNLPIVYFFPDLARSTLKAYRQLCRNDGAVPFTLGRGLDLLNDQQWDRQRTLNGCCFADLVDRLWRTTGDLSVLEEFYPAVKKSILYMYSLIPSPTGIISTAGDQWYESMAWPGMSSHVGGVRLATLQIASRMAESMNDSSFQDQCMKWIVQASRQLEKYLWAETHYRIFNDSKVCNHINRLQTPQDGAQFIANVNDGTGTSLDLVLSHQLDGEWISDFHGFSGVFKKERIDIALDTISRINLPLTTAGLLVVADPSGSPSEYGGRMGGLSTMPASTFITAMNFIYEGKKDAGLEIARNCLHEMFCIQGMTWDMPNILIGTKDHKSRVYGTDYYQCLSLWGLPAALHGHDLVMSASNDSLLKRILNAAREDPE